jgi:hypothetical protein
MKSSSIAIGVVVATAALLPLALGVGAQSAPSSNPWAQQCESTLGAGNALCNIDDIANSFLQSRPGGMSDAQFRAFFRRWLGQVNMSFQTMMTTRPGAQTMGASSIESFTPSSLPWSGLSTPNITGSGAGAATQRAYAACENVRGPARMRCINEQMQLNVWNSSAMSSSSSSVTSEGFWWMDNTSSVLNSISSMSNVSSAASSSVSSAVSSTSSGASSSY